MSRNLNMIIFTSLFWFKDRQIKFHIEKLTVKEIKINIIIFSFVLLVMTKLYNILFTSIKITSN